MSNNSLDKISAEIINIFTKLKSKKFNIHLLTSPIASQFSVDCVQSFNIKPSLTYNLNEIEDFIDTSESLLINLGMLNENRQIVSIKAINFINKQNKKWILDPVKIHRSSLRKNFCLNLIKLFPAIIKVNTDEYQSLFLNKNILSQARKYNTIIIKTGVIDIISNGENIIKIMNGHKFMNLGIAYGCALGALISSCLGIHKNSFECAVAAVAIMNITGELAAKKTTGPASFKNFFIDEMYNLSISKIYKYLNISIN